VGDIPIWEIYGEQDNIPKPKLYIICSGTPHCKYYFIAFFLGCLIAFLALLFCCFVGSMGLLFFDLLWREGILFTDRNELIDVLRDKRSIIEDKRGRV
tara:strand:+ start:384 stop:677 length:294 start_codon:yes stop_codon:yes gene_type:complete